MVIKLFFPTEEPGKEPSWLESMLIGKGSSLALAILCGKAMVPIKIPVALAVTPYVHRSEVIPRPWNAKQILIAHHALQDARAIFQRMGLEGDKTLRRGKFARRLRLINHEDYYILTVHTLFA